MVRNIALWGYGRYGRSAYELIRRSCADRLRVAAVFDARFEELGRGPSGPAVYDPERIGKHHRRGLFDAVMITVCDPARRGAIASRLASPRIPPGGRTLRRALPQPAGSLSPGPGRIFIRRTGTRRLLLPERSEAMLERCGFRTVVPDGLPAAEQIRLFSRARIVLSPHGANSANSLSMRPGSVFMETFPKAYANACCLETAYLGGVYYLPVPETHGKLGHLPDPFADYRIDPHLPEMSVRAAVALAEGREERG